MWLQVADGPGIRLAGVVDPQCETRRRVSSALLCYNTAQLLSTSGLTFYLFLFVVFIQPFPELEPLPKFHITLLHEITECNGCIQPKKYTDFVKSL